MSTTVTVTKLPANLAVGEIIEIKIEKNYDTPIFKPAVILHKFSKIDNIGTRYTNLIVLLDNSLILIRLHTHLEGFGKGKTYIDKVDPFADIDQLKTLSQTVQTAYNTGKQLEKATEERSNLINSLQNSLLGVTI